MELTTEQQSRADDIYREKLALLTSDGGFYCWQQINEIDLDTFIEIGRAIRDFDQALAGSMIVCHVAAILLKEAEQQSIKETE